MAPTPWPPSPGERLGKAVGVAPQATIASAIVIEGGQTVARVLGGLDWAVGPRACAS